MSLMPEWTKPGYWSLGRDPLGMQATSVRMYRTLVPGLTNVTNRLRYYSFYCWVIALYADARHADDDEQWRIFIRRAEALYALACVVATPDASHGLAGIDWARAYWQQFEGKNVDLRPYTDKPGENGQYLKAKRGNFGQFYVASMLEARLLQPSSGVPIVSEDRGQPLADAFADAVGNSVVRIFEETINTGTIAKAALAKIGEAVDPSGILATTKEMRLLREYLWARHPDASGDTTRRTSAWLLMDLARRGISIWDERSVRRAFYHRMLPGGDKYFPGGKVIDRWRAFQANELCHIALEAWLNGLAAGLQGQIVGVEPNKLIDDLVTIALPQSARRASFVEWTLDLKSSSEDFEEELCYQVLEGLKQPEQRAKDPGVLLAATKLLAILWHRWGSGANGVRDEVGRFSVRGGSSLAGVLGTLSTQKDAKTGVAIAAILRRYIIMEHLAIAARKLAASGKFTHRFISEDGTLSDGLITEYGYTNPRLRNLAQFLVDAKLIDAEGNVTPAGTRHLDDHQPA